MKVKGKKTGWKEEGGGWISKLLGTGDHFMRNIVALVLFVLLTIVAILMFKTNQTTQDSENIKYLIGLLGMALGFFVGKNSNS